MKIQYTEIRDRLVDKFSYSYRNPSALGNTGFICAVVNDILFDAGLRPIKSYMIIPELSGRLYGGDRNFMYNPMDENLFDGVEETTPESGLIEFYLSFETKAPAFMPGMSHGNLGFVLMKFSSICVRKTERCIICFGM